MDDYNPHLAQLIARGFDDAYIVEDGSAICPKCSQCEALVINGLATHEAGCPNARRECRGCNAMIPVNQKWCEGCAP